MDLAGKTVLVAEDDAFLSKVYGLTLKKEGVNAVFVKNGKEVVDFLAKQIPDLLLLDLIMPDMDGFKVLEVIRANAKTANLKVIVLTNLGQESDVETVKKYNVLDYIIKSSTNIKTILEKVKTVLAA